jgi:hypothetical protein
MRVYWLLVLVGCDYVYQPEPTDTDEPVSGGCPSGLYMTDEALLQITDFRIDALRYYPDFDPTTTYDDVPAACINPEGTTMELRFGISGVPTGIIHFSAEEAGNYDIVEDEGAEISLTVFNEIESLDDTFGTGSWEAGVAEVESVGDELVVTWQAGRATGLNGGYVQISFVAEVTVP